MRTVIPVALIVLCTPTPIPAEEKPVPGTPVVESFALQPGSAATIERDPGGTWRLMTGSPASDMASSKPTAGLIRFTFTKAGSVPGMMLRVENGYGRRFNYRGSLARGKDPPQRTSICPVLPGRITLEHWPYEFDIIIVAGFSLGGDESTLVCR